MASQDELSVCNLALWSIGVQGQVSSINPSDGSTEGNACSAYFLFVFQQLARTAKWGCLNKQLSLTLLQAALGTPENPTGTSLPIPQQPWLYGYLYPPDCLLMRQIFAPVIPVAGSGEPQLTVNNTVAPIVPGQFQIPYTIGYSNDASGNPLQVILTNQENAVANYTVDQPNPATWDALFTSAYVASLAAYLVPALSLDKQLQTIQIQVAERLIAQARAMDGNEDVVIQDHVPDWIRARQGATGWGGGLRGYNAYGPIGMNWNC
jgi:hypothetical protein